MSCRMFALLLLAVTAMYLEACTREPAQPPSAASPAAGSGQHAPLDGAALFKQYCATCHPDGGNVNDPKMHLHGSALRANRITTAEDIVRVMRHPISRMIRFDESMISDPEARAIAEYVLKTYK